MNNTKQKLIPYNTGKVLIGAQYQPRNEYPMSNFEYRLQESMLRKDSRAKAAFDLVCWLVATILIIWLYAVA